MGVEVGALVVPDSDLVEPICAELPIAPSTYYDQKTGQADPTRVPVRIRRGSLLSGVLETGDSAPRPGLPALKGFLQRIL